VTHEGMPAAFLASKVEDTGGFGTLMQEFQGSAYRGKRVRLRAWVKSKDVLSWAGLWLRIDRGEQALVMDNMQNRGIKGTSDWKMYDVVLDVPADSTRIAMGTLLDGPGEVWISGMKVEVVGNDVAVTTMGSKEEDGPVNLGFGQVSVVAPAHSPIAATPAYDTISIALSMSGNCNYSAKTTDDSMVAKNLPLWKLMEYAYGIKREFIYGLDEAVSSRCYDITAERTSEVSLPPGSDYSISALMQQNLLANKFHLKARIEERTLPVLELKRAESGIKMQQAPISADKHAVGNNGDFRSANTSMEGFAEWLTRHTGRTVVDATGLRGGYGVHVNAAALSGFPSGPHGLPESDVAAINAALQEQLGLMLQPAQRPMKTLTIDHVELPNKQGL